MCLDSYRRSWKLWISDVTDLVILYYKWVKHVITLYISIKTLIIRHMEDHRVDLVCPKMNRAPPHKNNLIGTAAVGVSKLVPLKMNNKALSTGLLLLARSLTNRKLVALDHRLTIRLKTPSKSIQHFVKVITTRNEELNNFGVPTKKPRPPITRGLPQWRHATAM